MYNWLTFSCSRNWGPFVIACSHVKRCCPVVIGLNVTDTNDIDYRTIIHTLPQSRRSAKTGLVVIKKRVENSWPAATSHACWMREGDILFPHMSKVIACAKLGSGGGPQISFIIPGNGLRCTGRAGDSFGAGLAVGCCRAAVLTPASSIGVGETPTSRSYNYLIAGLL